MAPTLTHEREFWKSGYRRVAGADEAGRGPLAGPVVAAAVVITVDSPLAGIVGINDSKRLSARHRERLAATIRLNSAYGLGSASAGEIDRHGIAAAGRLAMSRAIWSVDCDALLLDAFVVPSDTRPQRAIIHGDAICLSIAAASILAKVERDALLCDLDLRFPGYGLSSHKGYGTAEHLAALRDLGPTPEHRRSFAPLRLWLM